MLLDYIDILNSGDEFLIKTNTILLPLYIIAILLALSVHETAHGFIAYKCGDPTAKNLGRLTLNPISHIDPFGFICMLIAGFGWAKPVPVTTRNLKKPHRDMALVSLAGPVSNLLLALIFTIIYRIVAIPLFSLLFSTDIGFSTYLLYALISFLTIMVELNITLAVFNLLPIPPLDGSKILYTFIPHKLYFKIVPYEKYISLALMLLLVFGFLSPVISLVSGFIFNLMFSGVDFVITFIEGLFV